MGTNATVRLRVSKIPGTLPSSAPTLFSALLASVPQTYWAPCNTCTWCLEHYFLSESSTSSMSVQCPSPMKPTPVPFIPCSPRLTLLSLSLPGHSLISPTLCRDVPLLWLSSSRAQASGSLSVWNSPAQQTLRHLTRSHECYSR